MKEQSTNLRMWKWYLTDDKGQAYELVENRDSEGECSASKGADGVYVEQCDNQYFAKGMTALPKKSSADDPLRAGSTQRFPLACGAACCHACEKVIGHAWLAFSPWTEAGRSLHSKFTARGKKSFFTTVD